MKKLIAIFVMLIFVVSMASSVFAISEEDMQQARERYREAKQEYIEAKEAFAEKRAEITENREQLAECQGEDTEECIQLRRESRKHAARRPNPPLPSPASTS